MIDIVQFIKEAACFSSRPPKMVNPNSALSAESPSSTAVSTPTPTPKKLSISRWSPTRKSPFVLFPKAVGCASKAGQSRTIAVKHLRPSPSQNPMLKKLWEKEGETFTSLYLADATAELHSGEDCESWKL